MVQESIAAASPEPEHELTRDVRVIPREGRNPGNIIVGNTGLIILTGPVRTRPEDWQWHFVPDRQSTPPGDEFTRERNRNLFGYALAGLLDWKRNFTGWGEYGFTPQPHMTSVTFPWMDRFLTRILGGQAYRSIMLDTFSYSGTIHLDNLEQDNPVMERLYLMSQQVELTKPRMVFPPPERVTLN